MIQLTEQQLANIIKEAHKDGQNLIGYIDTIKAEEYSTKTVDMISNCELQICKSCNSEKVYDVFFKKWLCPVCDNVHQ